GRPVVNVIASELEALRIDIVQGRSNAARPEVEARLARVQQWWDQDRAGQSVPEAPETEFLARAFIGALDVPQEADLAQDTLTSALGRLDLQMEVKYALQRPAEDIGATRMNRAAILVALGRSGGARAELEACLQLFQNNPTLSSKVLASLADLFN